ncbi:MAG: hypothetical protein NTY03_01780 [Candidatus Bathyarchaeota archaeon]|nr:hypothetical protein [Candidatus Bathyarchaeota archaeon]
MVDLALLQSISYMAGALGVSVAALSFAFNMRTTTKNRRASLTNNLMNSFLSEEGMKRWSDLEIMKWKDFEDFRSKYDSTVNTDNYVKRQAFWNTCDLIGYQYREGLVDLGTVYNAGGIFITYSWLKFKPIIEEYRKTEYGIDDYENYEYVANELLKMKNKRDPSYMKKVKDSYSMY